MNLWIKTALDNLKAVLARVPAGTEDVNRKALDVGREAARKAREKGN